MFRRNTGFLYYGQRRNYLIPMGIVLTVVWLTGGAIYYTQSSSAFISMDQIGSFLEGFFAPLAFLWLVIGLFMQQREIRNNSNIVQMTLQHSAEQTRVLEATELRARQTAFFQIAESVKSQLGNLLGVLAEVNFGPDGNRRLNRDELNSYWEQKINNPEVFGYVLHTAANPLEGLRNPLDSELFFGSAERLSISEDFIRSFRSLLKMAMDCDDNGTIARSVMQTAFGLIYNNLVQAIEPPSAWIFLEEHDGWQHDEEQPIQPGRWSANTDTGQELEQWILTLEVGPKGDWQGSMLHQEKEMQFTDLIVDGSRLFARMRTDDHFFLITARAFEHTLTGTIDYDQGIYGRFEVWLDQQE